MKYALWIAQVLLALGLLAVFVAYGRARAVRRSSEQAPRSAALPATS